ncbi:hypothetical protein SAMD00019534_109040 [Acytostelium subglobosum LB1]|uniref:hypothetical protein n=1 Tax=Acytostelium subglobosum LB1 TaxID=1410327 RepID=UPI000644AC2C|nr:hypothetical protein SAMD00019534_109040 [Acytostelium subglobosum LB1]GAM27728.1 hypothetical protein SAMD00019534_109040 [Acytostelium subglobosum LB1]|eukprot:XP_012749387.1 hypothetical protein SAMD00019534_109040 [Acytostelium subglobosum LB1]
MGIPAFFRWMVDKYHGLIESTREPRNQDGTRIRCDNSEPNPNGEYDNLYLDMNGIIHPCAHPETGPQPRNTEDMMDSIIEYLDLIFSIVRPRNLVYMAVDGVAPRAKMNQQRSRRFRAAMDSRLAKEASEKEMMDRVAQGTATQAEIDAIQKSKEDKFHFDSNCITPGTVFMDLVSLTLRSYVAEKISTDPAWKNVKVIISDASVPGEGEHKIMSYIREQRAQKDYNPNLKHVIYGLDADLIMLALSTHEANFDILREFVETNKSRKVQRRHDAEKTEEELQEIAEHKDFLIKNYQLLSLNLFRSYLSQELYCKPAFGFDIERVIDDFIFICFFVGNDFLPHLPSLQINEGAIDRIMDIYRELLPTFDDYLTEDGEFDLDRVGLIFTRLSLVEEDIMLERKHKEENMKRRRERQNNRNNYNNNRGADSLDLKVGVSKEHQAAAKSLLSELFKEQEPQQPVVKKIKSEDTASNMDAAAKIREQLAALRSQNKQMKEVVEQVQANITTEPKVVPPKRQTQMIDIVPEQAAPPKKETKKRKERDQDEEEKKEEEEERKKKEEESLQETTFVNHMKDVNIGQKGWRKRYAKMHFEPEDGEENVLLRVCQSYIDGLAWVLKYYYKGCASWGWYYPFHYAPFILDLVDNLGDIVPPVFEKGLPFKPFEQLMSVLPRDSAQFVPKPYQKMMGVDDGSGDSSPIIHFYPTTFKIDVQPGVPLWKGICLLPFINEQELQESLRPLDNVLTDEEIFRNSRGSEYLFANKNVEFVAKDKKGRQRGDIDPKLSKDFLGKIDKLPQRLIDRLPPMQDAVAYEFHNPGFPEGYEFKSAMLPGAIMLPRTQNTTNQPSIQNSAANRMINHSLGSNQYKDNQGYNQGRGFNGGGGRGGYQGGGGRGGYQGGGRGGYNNNNSNYGGNRNNNNGGGGYNNDNSVYQAQQQQQQQQQPQMMQQQQQQQQQPQMMQQQMMMQQQQMMQQMQYNNYGGGYNNNYGGGANYNAQYYNNNNSNYGANNNYAAAGNYGGNYGAVANSNYGANNNYNYNQQQQYQMQPQQMQQMPQQQQMLPQQQQIPQQPQQQQKQQRQPNNNDPQQQMMKMMQQSTVYNSNQTQPRANITGEQQQQNKGKYTPFAKQSKK